MKDFNKELWQLDKAFKGKTKQRIKKFEKAYQDLFICIAEEIKEGDEDTIHFLNQLELDVSSKIKDIKNSCGKPSKRNYLFGECGVVKSDTEEIKAIQKTIETVESCTEHIRQMSEELKKDIVDNDIKEVYSNDVFYSEDYARNVVRCPGCSMETPIKLKVNVAIKKEKPLKCNHCLSEYRIIDESKGVGGEKSSEG